MCLHGSQSFPSTPLHNPVCRRLPKRSKVRIHRLTRRRRRSEEAVKVVGGEMELKNLKLYLENRSIIEENQKLRKKALLLHQENRALLFELQKKSLHLHDFANNLLQHH